MAARKGGGFWRGVVVGLLLAVLAALALAWSFPPLRAPDVDAGALASPGPLAAPTAAAEPGPATPEDGLPPIAAPAGVAPPAPDRTP